MRLTPLLLAGLTVLPAAPLAAQLRSSRPPRPAANLPRLLVANPYTFSSGDSAAAVRIGAGLRERTEGKADKWYTVIERTQMNEALRQYAYPEDAVLPPLVARQLAASLQARAMIVSTMSREQGRLLVESRLIKTSQEAGHMVRLTQAANQSFEELGQRLADSLENAFKALPDAEQCEALRGTNPQKAAESAAKALRVQPNHGLASFCLAQIAITRKAPVDSIIVHLKNSTKGDRLSLDSWTALAVQYQAKGDTTNTVDTFKEMLRVAPTNQKLREEVFRYFLSAGQLDAAEGVANEGIAIDSANADMWDLRAGACLFQEDKPEKVRCALESIDQVYALDTAKADTLFITKAIYAATRDSAPDTTRLVKWTGLGIRKYPNNSAILAGRVTAFAWTGPIDSLVSATRSLLAVDSTDLTPVVRAAKALAEAKRGAEAMELGQYIERLGGPQDKQNLAIILAQNAPPLLQQGPDQNLALAADMARKALSFAQPNTPLHGLASYALGLSTFFQAAALDQDTEKTKSCEGAQKMKTLFDEAGPALRAGREMQAAYVDNLIKGVDQFTPRVNSMIKAYCK
jgi:tetratricopeptide (TPR) repeat protein